MNDEDDFVLVFTHQNKWYTRLKKNPLFECLREGQEGRTKWGEFRGPVWALSLLTRKQIRGAS